MVGDHLHVQRFARANVEGFELIGQSPWSAPIGCKMKVSVRLGKTLDPIWNGNELMVLFLR
jgi:hypothetical protein